MAQKIEYTSTDIGSFFDVCLVQMDLSTTCIHIPFKS